MQGGLILGTTAFCGGDIDQGTTINNPAFELGNMKRLCLVGYVCSPWAAPKTSAFVMVGPMDPAELASGGIDSITDDLGGPQGSKDFFRWNIPLLTYAFDASFMQYFGLEGRDAVKVAFTSVNDFFDNNEYSGVSSLELTTHGFRSNYNTTG